MVSASPMFSPDVAVPNHQVPLQFSPAQASAMADLSAVLMVDQTLWLGSDESAHLEAFTLTDGQGCQHRTLSVADYIALPDGPGQEIDIEGLAYQPPYLWLVGSHSLKRKRPKLEHSPDKNLARLHEVVAEPNRYLLGRIPLIDGQLHPFCPDPTTPSRTLTAATLKWHRHGNQLTKALRQDPQLRPYLKGQIPGKENGFDIEGMAVLGDRILLGLRGPVLRGWAILLEISLKDHKPGLLKLRHIGEDGQPYRKHFVYLEGLGIRDLHVQGEDLLILAGPTMDHPGPARLFRLPQVRQTLALSLSTPSPLLTISGGLAHDKAEGLTLLPDNSALVVYDSPAAQRVDWGAATVLADVFTLPG